MSNTLTPIITAVGLAAVFNAHNDGLDAKIVEIALGDAAWTPDKTATALQNEQRRIAVSGERINDTQIHLTAVEDGTDLQYWVREVGFYLDDGTLLAVWSNDQQALAYKSAGVDLLLAFDLVLSALPSDSVIVDGKGGFNLPPATDSKPGVIRIATEAEVTAGELTDVAINPAQLKASINDSESFDMDSLLSQDGNGSGLDADLLRGLPADFSNFMSTTGYQKLPSGLIIQWGRKIANVKHGGNYIFTFPIAFPNTSLTAVANEYGGNHYDVQLQITSMSATSVTVHVDGTHSSNYAGGAIYIAIGY